LISQSQKLRKNEEKRKRKIKGTRIFSSYTFCKNLSQAPFLTCNN
jgi:hypothetical protein